MTIAELRRTLEYWRVQLGLDHWNITCAFGTQDDLRAGLNEFLYASVNITAPRHTAHILMFKWRDLVKAEQAFGISLIGKRTRERLYEEAIIHELLHVRLDPRERLAFDSAFETGLDVMASILYDMRHGN